MADAIFLWLVMFASAKTHRKLALAFLDLVSNHSNRAGNPALRVNHRNLAEFQCFVQTRSLKVDCRTHFYPLSPRGIGPPPIFAIIFCSLPIFFIICCIWVKRLSRLFNSATVTPLPLAMR